MDIADWNGLHKKWVKARDAAKPKVAAGAVKGVSMGDAIDAVVKAAKKDYPALEKAVKELQKDVTAYGKGIHAKNPVLVKWIEANIAKPADDLLDDLEADAKLLNPIKKIGDKMPIAKDAAFPALAAIAAYSTQEKKPWAKMAPEEHKQMVTSAAYYTGFHDALVKAAKGLKLDLPKSKLRDALTDSAASMKTVIEILEDVAGSKSGDDLKQTLPATRNIEYTIARVTVAALDAVREVLPR